ncbi:DUF4380 domain-containing protein [Chitinispirillales bacterium ANBcel5]|uniref:DUF4380 domain-containing protein n=1 Tax=Cellulosispirillum alkaliphilum TaxID=3039283 RepID=UPI002A57578F|nr:DUF4380 domain-containing protein [Chitinispirillales bacterium ANBcel5]
MAERLIKLSSGNVEVGVLADLGGRVVLLRLAGMNNILKADSSLWNSPPKIKKTFSPEARWRAYNGHIVWLGPQSGWWTQQDKSPRRLRRKAQWPPDPYLCYGNYQILEITNRYLLMLGPESEFSGVQLLKSIYIDELDRVIFKVRAKNIRNEAVSWDLWLNTRLDGFARCYVPVNNPTKVRTLCATNSRLEQKSDFSHTQGFYCLDPLSPKKEKKCRWTKAFIPADKGFMAAFNQSQSLIIHFKPHPESLIHPEHSLVELYNYTTHSRSEALNELEYHTPYVTLQPGETMETSQIWQLSEYSQTSDSHAPYISHLNTSTQKHQCYTSSLSLSDSPAMPSVFS